MFTVLFQVCFLKEAFEIITISNVTLNVIHKTRQFNYDITTEVHIFKTSLTNATGR